MKERSNLEKFA